MTEEIIIDGVDVSECEFFDRGEILDGCSLGYREDPVNNYTPNCQDNNCYYKQLKRTQNALQNIKTLVTTDYIQIKRQLVQNYDCLDNFMQKIEDKCSEVL